MEKMLDQTGVKLSPELKAEIEVAIRTYARRECVTWQPPNRSNPSSART